MSYIDFENIHLASPELLKAQVTNHSDVFVANWDRWQQDYDGIGHAKVVVDELQSLLNEMQRRALLPYRETRDGNFDAEAMVTRLVRAQEAAFSRASHLDVG